jgi:hypothetical protein
VVRLLLRFVLALLAAAVSCAGLALAADAATIVSGPISSNTTWTPAGSPYLLNGNVTVAAGVTLTIQPGVVVKLNGTTRYLQVNGTLSAIGSAASPITFTSIQDDSIAGDSGGDGPTTGAPGQWYDIRISSGNGASLLKFVEVRYGGWGTIYNYGYGALSVSGSSTVTVEDAAFRNNQRSGIKVGPGAAAVVRRTTLSNNGNGISVSDGRLELSDRSVVSSNAQDGVWFSFASNFTGPASSLKDSDVTVNGRYGVYIQASGFSGSLLPSGSGTTSRSTRPGSCTPMSTGTTQTRPTGTATSGVRRCTSGSRPRPVAVRLRTRRVTWPTAPASSSRRRGRSARSPIWRFR